MTQQNTAAADPLALVAPAQRRFAEANWERILWLYPRLGHWSPEEVRDLIDWLYERPEELYPEKRPREKQLSPEHEIRSEAALQDEGVQFSNEPVKNIEDVSPQELVDRFLERLEVVATQIRTKRKQVFVLEMLEHVVLEREGYRLKGVLHYDVGTRGERLVSITTSALTDAINGLSDAVREGRTVTMPTVRSALQAVLDNVQDTDGKAGNLRTKKKSPPDQEEGEEDDESR